MRETVPRAIRLENLTLSYDRHPAVHHLSGLFPPGSLTAIVGPNGAGKSTLLKGIKGLLPVLEGRIDRYGLTPQQLAYLPQQADLDRDFPISVLEVVALGQWQQTGAWATVTPEQITRAHQALAAVGLKGFEHRSLAALSIGQRQRVLFARVLVADSPVILLDEPFAAIDNRTTADLLELVQRWHGEGRTVIAVLHDFAQVRDVFPQTLLLAREAIAWGPTDEVLSSANILRARSLDEAWNDQAPVCQRETPPEKEPDGEPGSIASAGISGPAPLSRRTTG